MPVRAHTTHPSCDPASLLRRGIGAADHIGLTPEQDYRARAMGEEELELLRAAASPDGLPLASLNWILASLENHGFVTVSSRTNRGMRAVATEAGFLALSLRPLVPLDNVH